MYDLPSKLVLLTIQLSSPASHLAVDQLESSAFIACENLNVYQIPLLRNQQQPTSSSATDSTQQNRRVFTHKKRITAMTLTHDNRQLVTGDSAGLIHVWSLDLNQTM